MSADERSAFARWRELHAARFVPTPEDFAEPMLAANGEHEPLCVWDGQRVPDPCFGCELVQLRSDATYEKGELRTAAREALHELLAIVQGHVADVEDRGDG